MDNFLNMIELTQMTNDRRQPWKISHKIGDIIMNVLVCLLANIDEWEEDFASQEEKTYILGFRGIFWKQSLEHHWTKYFN